MTRWNDGWVFVWAIVATGGLAGCGSTDQSPLGGPYGGTATLPGPEEGSGSSGANTAPASEPAEGGAPAEAGGGSGSSGISGSSSSGGGGGNSGSSGSSGGSSSGAPAAPPSWTAVYDAYLASGTNGHCTNCHNQMSSPSAAYSFLESQGFISGSTTKLAGSGSCLMWFGGNMPPGGTGDAQAVTDVTAWAAAGAQNN
jgi:hypothetical protein